MGERGNYYSKDGEREQEDLSRILQAAFLLLVIFAGVFFLSEWGGIAPAPAGQQGIAASPTPAMRIDYLPAPRPSTRPAILVRFKNQSFAPETITVGNTTITVSRTVGFAGGRRIETLVFNNTGTKPASFRTLVMFPKRIAQNASDIEVAGAAPGEVYVLQEDPSLFVNLKDLAAGASRAISFLSPVQTMVDFIGGGGGGGEAENADDISAGSIHFVLPGSYFPLGSGQRDELDALLNSPWMQSQTGPDAQTASEQLSRIFSEAEGFEDAISKARALFSGSSGESIGGGTATGEKISPPVPRKCSDGAINVSEFMPGFYCEEEVPREFLNPQLQFVFSVQGLDEYKPQMAISYADGRIAISADYRALIAGGKMPITQGTAQGSIQYADASVPRGPDGSLRTFEIPLAISYENNFNNYVKIWPPELHFKEYGGTAVQKAVLVSNNLPYSLEGYDFRVCGRRMDVGAGAVGAFVATISDKGCEVAQRGQKAENGFLVNVSTVDFLSGADAQRFVAEDYIEPRVISSDAGCSNNYCNCGEASDYAKSFAGAFLGSLPADTFSYKTLFGKNDYSATRIFLSAKAKDGSVCPLPSELQAFGLWPARLNIAKLDADLREDGEKTVLENNGYWSGNWAIKSGKADLVPSQWFFESSGNFAALSGLTREPFVYYSLYSANGIFQSGEYSFYTLGQR
jgi:hypothetical protein